LIEHVAKKGTESWAPLTKEIRRSPKQCYQRWITGGVEADRVAYMALKGSGLHPPAQVVLCPEARAGISKLV
jgi:hypothetical protein